MAAVKIARGVFSEDRFGEEHLPSQKATLLLVEVAEGQRAAQGTDNFGAISPGLMLNTTDLLFQNPWLRPAHDPSNKAF